ncbi:Hypothetical protein A7982_11625 [Minicystis rosea]|nr:Hypothetical protein A7982_11625 [Minicystis rosea]
MALSRPLAQRRLQQHEARFGARHVDFAAHAALPVVLDPRLVHLLRINFFLDADDPLPWTAETDLLFSPICTDLGDGLYEIEATTRTLLLERLAASEHGERRIGEVANLLWVYLHRRPAPWAHEPGLERAQELTALQLLDPGECERWLSRAEVAVSGDAVAERPWFVAMRRKLEPMQAVAARKKEGWPRFNGRRVLVVGTGTEGLRGELQWMSQALGAALARAGFGLVGGGWPGVDRVVAESYVTTAREIDSTDGHLEHVRTAGSPSFSSGTVTFVPDQRLIDATLERADAVVLIGGREWTMRTFERALALGKRVFPVAGTGGSAAKALENLRSQPNADTELLDALDGPIRASGRAELLAARLIELLNRQQEEELKMSVNGTMPQAFPFTRFRAEGFADLDPVEANGLTLLETLRGPTDARKSALIAALQLLGFLLDHGETGFGPPLQQVTPVPFGPDHAGALGSTPVVISADVVVAPEHYKSVRGVPAVLSLDTIGITLCLNWGGTFPGSTIRRFVVGTGRDFATGERTIPEIQDLHLGVYILVAMISSVLAAARAPRPTGMPKPALGEREQRIVDVVVAYALKNGQATPNAEVFLSFPRGKAEKEAVQAAVESLVRQRHLQQAGEGPNGEALIPTLAGLMASAHADEVAGVAERLLDYLVYRAGKERGRFTHYTLHDLELANVIGHDQLSLARVVIAFFRLGAGTGTVWEVRPDIAELRDIEGIRGLLDRCVRLHGEEEATRAVASETAREPTSTGTHRTDVLLVTVTKIETQAVLAAADAPSPPAEHIDGRVYFDLGDINGARVRLTRCEMGTSTLGGAQQAIAKAVAALSPSAVVMVGIAFGIAEGKQSLGDILVTEQLRLYDLARVGTHEGKAHIVLRGDKPHASPSLINLYKSADLTWNGAAVRFGTVLSGDKLVDNLDYRDQLRGFEPEAIGGEMEGAGLYVACHEAKVDWILIKAICDWADGKKGRDKDARQALAAKNAAEFALHALRFVKVDWKRG